ncbi:MAG: hypothetical protein GQ565_03060 [Candidatus Aegiribacteria sp.]|nr:hypothetical protein [Candidatus Aegiribacteria sp.]
MKGHKTKLLKTENGYDFWYHHNPPCGSWWNITPAGSGEPDGGYTNRAYIEGMKHQSFALDVGDTDVD